MRYLALLCALLGACVVRAVPAPAPVVYERRVVAPPRPMVYRAPAPRCHGVWVEGYYDAWGSWHPGYWRCY